MGTHSGIRNEPEKRNVRITESSIIAKILHGCGGDMIYLYI